MKPHNYDCALSPSIKNFTSKVYKYISGDLSLLQNKYNSWSKHLGADLCKDVCEFGRLHQYIYKISNVPKYRSFQYRLLQRGLVTNVQLEKWGIISSSACFYCNNNPEEIEHLLVLCPIVQVFWSEVFDWICQKFVVNKNELRIKLENIIRNDVHKYMKSIINFIVLLAKFYIYRQKWSKGNLNIKAFIRFVLNIEKIEKYIAIKNNKLYIHNKKWSRCSTAEDFNLNLNQYIRDYIGQVE